MSADNWAVCPRCQLKPNPYYEDLDSTLREDYEIGIVDGELYIGYRGQCQTCGFLKTFEHTEKVN